MSDQSAPAADDFIVIEKVTKEFRTGAATITAANGISLRIAAGHMVAVTGRSGSGKSTLLHLVGAIEKADGGSITIGGQEITRLSRRQAATYRSRIGFVFQRYHLLPALTVLDNVIAPVLPYRVAFDPVDRARELLDAVGLAGRERSLPAQLSGGQQQRVAIARALINRPRLLLADEPTGNLDSATGADVLDLLRSLRDEHDMTIVLATHDQQVAGTCDRVIRVQDGTVVADEHLTPTT